MLFKMLHDNSGPRVIAFSIRELSLPGITQFCKWEELYQGICL